MAKQWVDSGATHLAVCDCGWRGGIELDRGAAWRQAHAHGRSVHSDGTASGKALEAWRRRHG